MVKRTTVLVLVLLLLAAPLRLMAAQVSAVADRDRLGEGESLRLELRVQGSPDDDPDLGVLDPDWEILGRSQSSRMQLVNGDFSRSVVYSLTLMPRRSGALEIPAVCFGSDCSAPLSIRVSKEAAASRAEAPLLLEAEAGSRRVPVGAQVLLTVRLLHRVELAQASLSEPQPEGVEAEIRRIGEDRSFEVPRDGVLYRAIERRYALFPQKAGTLHIPGLRLDAQIGSAPSTLDPFGRSVRTVRRLSEALDIEVEPIPAEFGGRNWLPAKSVSLGDDWQQSTPRLRVGEPATRTLTLRASGLPAAHLPELKPQIPEGWKSYPDQPSREDDTDADGIVGTLQQKIALVPTRPGSLDLPPVDFDWYDVAARRWRSAHLDAVRVTVDPAPPGEVAPAARPPVSPQAPPPESPPPRPAFSPGQAAAPTVDAGFWPWLSLALGLGWLLTLLLFWRQRRRPPLQPPPEGTDRPGAAREKDALKSVRAAAGRNDPAAARRALLDWSRCRWPDAAHHDLERLALTCGEPLAGELALLGRALYAESATPWQGAGLASALRGWLKPQQDRPRPDALPPLYPKGDDSRV